MSLTDSISKSNSINSINESNKSIKGYIKDIKECFSSIKQEKDKKEISKLINNNNKKIKKIEKIPLRQNVITNISNANTKFQTSSQLSTPIEFYCEYQDFVKKDTVIKMEQKRQKEIFLKEEKKRKEKEKILQEKKKKKQNSMNEKNKIFFKRVEHYQNKKKEHLNNIKKEMILRNEKKNELKTIKMNKSSILLYPKYRKPLYQYKNIKENQLIKTFSNFYNYGQNERNKNESKNLSSINNKKVNSFYGRGISWLKQKDEKVEKNRNLINLKSKSYSYSYKPDINKTSIQLLKNKEKLFNFLENSINNKGIQEQVNIKKQDIYQKYLFTIKPFINYYFEKNSTSNKRTQKKRKSNDKLNKSVKIGMIHSSPKKNISLLKQKIIENNKKQKDFFNIFKPDKKVKKETKEKRGNFWWNQFKNMKNNNNKKSHGNKELLYKVNVRDNCSWNRICVNQVIPKDTDKKLLLDIFL